MVGRCLTDVLQTTKFSLTLQVAEKCGVLELLARHPLGR